MTLISMNYLKMKIKNSKNKQFKLINNKYRRNLKKHKQNNNKKYNKLILKPK